MQVLDNFGARVSCALCWAVALAAVVSCTPLDGAKEVAAGSVDSREPPSWVAPYAPGTWRLAPQEDLDRTLLHISHILIRHVDGRNGLVSFSAAEWRSVAPPPTRTRLKAFSVASEIAAKLDEDPSRFAEEARHWSEDITTRDLGGSLGAIVASQLQEWPQVLDALESVPVGSASRVVETDFGFHIFYRAQAPVAEVVTGARIVIGHDAAPWIRVAARGAVPARSRDAAWQRALAVYERAKADPDQFDALVEEFSDHRDAQRHGDMGGWSATEPTSIGREVSTLQKLALGEVAAPIETVFGIQVIKRVQNRPRKDYAMLAIRLPFETRGPDAAGSQSRARELSEQLSAQIRGNPEAFFGLLHDSGGGLEQWQEGRASAAVEEHLDGLQLDEISAKPILDDMGYVLARRVRPSPVRPSLNDLRARGTLDVIELLSAVPRDRAQSLLAACAREYAPTPQLKDELAALHREWSTQFLSAGSHPARLAAIAELQARLRRGLGDSGYQTYLQALRQRLQELQESTLHDRPPQEG